MDLRKPDKSNMGILKDGAAAGLPQITKIDELDNCINDLERGLAEFEKMKHLKEMQKVYNHVKDAIDTLKDAQEHLLEQD